MKKAARIGMKPTTLRLLLALCMFVVLGLSIGGFILVEKKINEFAVEVSHKKVDAAASRASLQTLQRLQKELASSEAIINKAKGLKHASELPQFKAIEDIRNHAKANNLSISGITFATASAAPSGTATPAPPSATAPAAAPLAATGDSVDVTFNLGDGTVQVVDFINFLYDIEHSIPKMQIQGIDVTAGGGNSEVEVGQMTVKLFTKKIGQ